MKDLTFNREAHLARWGTCPRRSRWNQPIGFPHIDNGNGVCVTCKTPRNLERYSGPWWAEIAAERRKLEPTPGLRTDTRLLLAEIRAARGFPPEA